MQKVYVPNDQYHDFSDAKRFGELIFLTTGNVNRFHVNEITRQVDWTLRDASEFDYLLISGLPVISAIAASILSMKFGQINLLQFHGREHIYVERTVYFHNEDEVANGHAS